MDNNGEISGRVSHFDNGKIFAGVLEVISEYVHSNWLLFWYKCIMPFYVILFVSLHPRCKKWSIPIEKIYNKTQREKFAWAIDMAEDDYEF